MKFIFAVIAFAALFSSSFANPWDMFLGIGHDLGSSIGLGLSNGLTGTNGMGRKTDLIQSISPCDQVISDLVAPAIDSAAKIGAIEVGPGCGTVSLVGHGLDGYGLNGLGLSRHGQNAPCSALGWGPSALAGHGIF